MRKREKERKKCFYYSLYIFISSLQLHSFAFHPPLSLSLSLCLSLSLSLSLSLASHQLIFITKNNSILFSTNSHFSPLLEFFPTFTFFPPFSQEIKKRGRETRERGMERYPLEVAKGRDAFNYCPAIPPSSRTKHKALLSRVLLETSTQTGKLRLEGFQASSKFSTSFHIHILTCLLFRVSLL